MSLPEPGLQPREFLTHLFQTAVQRALPLHNTAAYLPTPPANGGHTIVLGAGKAAAAMAQAVEVFWPSDAPLSGLVVTRYHHVPVRPAELNGKPARIEIVEAAHPVPDAAGLQAAQRILDMTYGLSENDVVLCLISGGGSALLSLPVEGLDFLDKQRINQALLDSGAPISEMNCVRKHLSSIKGGRLAAACAPARVVTLMISDVPGDDPGIIASGPTVPDDTTCAQALSILKRYNIDVPASVAQRLATGALETPKSSDPVFKGHIVHMTATPRQSLEAAAVVARSAGLHAYILSDDMEGESREVGKVHAALARTAAKEDKAGVGQTFIRPCVLLSGGETTVTVRPRLPGTARGRGGRAGEFCLGLAQSLHGLEHVYALAADTDGIDGVQDNAGAFVEPATLVRAEALGMQIHDYLDRNDAYGYFEPLGDLVITGPTFTNVNDFRAILVL
ncbi:MAG: glycerate kinase [Burkholderiaceae bacterium]|nr:glycerate kinase [Burkholderiaceae bacterium]